MTHQDYDYVILRHLTVPQCHFWKSVPKRRKETAIRCPHSDVPAYHRRYGHDFANQFIPAGVSLDNIPSHGWVQHDGSCQPRYHHFAYSDD
jgi:hypothetical protein